MKLWTVTPLLLALAACSSNPEPAPTPQPVVQTPASPPLTPAGNYEFSTVVEGQTITGTMQITGTPGAYSGRILTNMFPEIPVVGATVEGRKVIVKASMPDGELTINMNFGEGLNFTGNWELGGQTGNFTGRKLP